VVRYKVGGGKEVIIMTRYHIIGPLIVCQVHKSRGVASTPLGVSRRDSRYIWPGPPLTLLKET
jgi:hypothetical protein